MSADVCQAFVDGLQVGSCSSSGSKSIHLLRLGELVGDASSRYDGEGRYIDNASDKPCAQLECNNGDSDSDSGTASGQPQAEPTSSAGRGVYAHTVRTPAHVQPAAGSEEMLQHLTLSSGFGTAFSVATPKAAAAAAATAARAAGGDRECPVPLSAVCGSNMDLPPTTTASTASGSCQNEDAPGATVAADHSMCSIIEEPGGYDGGFYDDQAAEAEEHTGFDCQQSGSSSSRRRKSSLNDLDKLKRLATRLGLNTRRPSYTAWLQGTGISGDSPMQHLAAATPIGTGTAMESSTVIAVSCCSGVGSSSCDDIGHSLSAVSTADTDNGNVREKIARVDRSLQDLRSELIRMQEMDQTLAKKFISLRHDVQQLRLQHTQLHYEDLLDEAAARSLTGSSRSDDLLANDDMPLLRGRLDSSDSSGIAGSDLDAVDALSQLTSIGITKMNLLERRFSVF